MRTMKRACGIVSYLTAFLLMTPAICPGGQFKITRVYDGNTVKAEGYDRQCLG
jgi:hypothetical protein